MGGIAADALIDFQWTRVPNAEYYVLTVWDGPTSGPPVLNMTTVNDHVVGNINYAGDLITWRVDAYRAEYNVPASGASATFTSVRWTSELDGPADGATVDYPSMGLELGDRPLPDQGGAVLADQHIGDTAPLLHAPGAYDLGTWRWDIDPAVVASRTGTKPPTPTVRTFTRTWSQGTPVLTSPADGSTAQPRESIRLAWDQVPGAAVYIAEFGLVGGSPIVHTYQGQRANWLDVATSVGPGTYQWRVRALSGGPAVTRFLSPWSAYRTLSVVLPGTPSQTWPADGATLDAFPVLRWTDVAGATAYGVQVATAPVDNPAADPGASSETASWSFFRPGEPIDPTGLYSAAPGVVTRYWRVVTLGPAGSGNVASRSAWSPWRSFTVDPGSAVLGAETPATLLGPADCATDACPDLDGVPLFRWAQVAGAASYRVFIRRDGGDGAADYWFDTGSTGKALPEQDAGRVAWSVLACPVAGCSTTRPATRSHFRITFGAPTPDGPGDPITQAPPSVGVSWQVATPTQPDTLYLKSHFEFAYTVTPGTGGATDTYINLDAPDKATVDTLKNGATLAWHVRQVWKHTYYPGMPYRVDGAWSAWRYVTRTELPITLTSPVGGATTGSHVTLRWEGVPYAHGGYSVALVNLADLSDNPSVAVPSWGTTTGATEADVRMTLPPGNYRWSVQTATQSDGSPLVSYGYFTVPGDAVVHLVSPIAGADVRADDAAFKWTPIAGADEYAVAVATSPEFTDASLVWVGWIGDWAVLHAPVLLPTGDFYWRVCSQGFGGRTSCATDTLHISAAPGPDLSAPDVGTPTAVPTAGGTIAANGVIPVSIAWSASDVGVGIGSQTVEIRRGTGAWVAYPVAADARTYSAWLAQGSQYTIRIRATDLVANESLSATRAVTTELRQDTLAKMQWTWGWTRRYAAGFSGGSSRSATRNGATVSTTVVASSIAIVAPRSTTRGSAVATIDGVRAGVIALNIAPAGSRRLVLVKTWGASGTHRITIRVMGTAKHPRVDIDAIVVLR